MHSRIFQLTETKLEESEYAIEDIFYDDDKIDYAIEIKGENRQEEIDYLVSDILPKGMFSRGEGDSIIYNGGVEKLKEDWCNQVKEVVSGLTPNSITSMLRYTIQRMLREPFENRTLFVLTGWSGDCAVHGCELVDWIERFKPGKVLYVGSVFDYHW